MRIESHMRGEIFCHRYRAADPRYALLISHGIGGHGGIYDIFCERMAELGADVWSYDAPGHGRSTTTRPRGRWTLDEWVKAGTSYAEHIAGEYGHTVFALGSSLGGGAAYGTLAATDAVKGGIFMGTVSIPEALPDNPAASPQVAAVLKRFGRSARLDIAMLVDFDEDYGYAGAAEQKRLDPYNTWSYDLASMLSMGTCAPRVSIGDNKKPVLFAVGEKDPFAPPARVLELKNRFGGPATYKMFEGASHQLMLFHTNVFSTLVHEWCLSHLR